MSGIVWTPSLEFRWLDKGKSETTRYGEMTVVWDYRWAKKVLQQKWNGVEYKTEGCEVKAISHEEWREIETVKEKERGGIVNDASVVFP